MKSSFTDDLAVDAEVDALGDVSEEMSGTGGPWSVAGVSGTSSTEGC